jgi:hypothetical protein
MNFLKVVVVLIFSVTILSGCRSEKIEIPRNDYKLLYIQGVDKNGTASDETQKEIQDIDKINNFIKRVDSMEVSEQKSDKINQIIQRLKDSGNYIIVLSNSEKLQGEMYHINIFEDGTFMYQDPYADDNNMKYISIEKNPELYEDIKDLLMISF